MESEHAQGPLKVEVGKPNHLGNASIEFSPPIIRCDDDGMFGKPADAAFVVLAWNAHDDEIITDLVAALELILPMAKGYASEHRVGSNQQYVEVAEAAIARSKVEA